MVYCIGARINPSTMSLRCQLTDISAIHKQCLQYSQLKPHTVILHVVTQVYIFTITRAEMFLYMLLCAYVLNFPRKYSAFL